MTDGSDQTRAQEMVTLIDRLSDYAMQHDNFVMAAQLEDVRATLEKQLGSSLQS